MAKKAGNRGIRPMTKLNGLDGTGGLKKVETPQGVGGGLRYYFHQNITPPPDSGLGDTTKVNLGKL